MKNELLGLIQQIDSLKSRFHYTGGDGIPRIHVIYDIFEFVTWKQELQLELQDVYDRTNDKFVHSTLAILQEKFNGWNDETSFTELTGSLLAIRKNIDKYYPPEISEVKEMERMPTMPQKSPKIFISHATLDKSYASVLVGLLEDIGLNEDQIFCSSVPGYGIPLDEDIYEYLHQQFETHNLHVIFVLSENYYKSVACMNEMGAAWILQNKYTTVLLPSFEFVEIKGAINPRRIGLKLDNDLTDVKEKLGQLKDALIEEFALSSITDVRWERKRDAFINTISNQNPQSLLSDSALLLLQSASSDPQGAIIKSATLSGESISVGTIGFISSQERREVAKWENALDELLEAGFIQPKGNKGVIFVVTQKGYDYISQL